jgi:hypothetical protein
MKWVLWNTLTVPLAGTRIAETISPSHRRHRLMKVKAIEQGISSVFKPRGAGGPEMKDGDFQKLLGEATHKLGETGRSVSPTSPLKISEIHGPAPVLPIFPDPETMEQVRSRGIDAAGSLLSTLEQYQSALANSGTSLKGVQGYVESLARGVKDLSLLSEKLSPSDPLQKIMAEVGILSTVEVERFNRGEYIE